MFLTMKETLAGSEMCYTVLEENRYRFGWLAVICRAFCTERRGVARTADRRQSQLHSGRGPPGKTGALMRGCGAPKFHQGWKPKKITSERRHFA